MNSRFLIRRLQYRFIAEHITDRPYSLVVDVGGGKSPYAKLVTAEQYVATDVEDRLGEGGVVFADANKHLPFKDSSVDLIICTEVLEHLHSPLLALKEMYRILRREGTLLLTTPMVWEEHEIPHDYYRYTQYGIHFLSTEAGFKDADIRLSNGYWYTMLVLLLSRMRHWIYAPLVVFLNVIGLAVFRFERRAKLSLGIHAVIKK